METALFVSEPRVQYIDLTIMIAPFVVVNYSHVRSKSRHPCVCVADKTMTLSAPFHAALKIYGASLKALRAARTAKLVPKLFPLGEILFALLEEAI